MRKMTRRISLIIAVVGAGLVLAVPAAWGANWGADRQEEADFWNYDQQGKQIANSSPGVSPEVLAKLYSGVTTESSAPIASPTSPIAAKQSHVADMLTARKRGLGARVDPTTSPAPVSATSSGRELEWPQIGIGFGIGAALMLGVFLVARGTRQRQPAH